MCAVSASGVEGWSFAEVERLAELSVRDCGYTFAECVYFLEQFQKIAVSYSAEEPKRDLAMPLACAGALADMFGAANDDPAAKSLLQMVAESPDGSWAFLRWQDLYVFFVALHEAQEFYRTGGRSQSGEVLN